MTRNSTKASGIQRVLMPLLGAAVSMAFLFQGKVAGHSDFVIHLAAQAVDVASSENAGRIDILIQKWSTDDDLQRMRDAVPRRDQLELLSLLHHTQRRVGIILMPGVQGHGARARLRTPRNLLFARQVITPSGRRIVAASDEHLGLGEPAIDARRSVSEFNLIDIRLDPVGTGIGKVAVAEDLSFSADVGSLELKDYRKRPARLIDVREEPER